jgi:hypothetical protein
MSRAAYERVRLALEGTALAGQLEKFNAELHLTPESPEWTIAALGMIAGQALTERLDSAEIEFSKTAAALPDGLRAAGTEVTRGLAADIATSAAAKLIAEVHSTYKSEIEKQMAFSTEILGAHSRETTALVVQAEDVIAKSAGIPGQALAQVNAIKPLVADLRDLLRGYFYVFLWLPLIAVVVGFIAGGIFEYSRSHTAIFHQGWNAGVQAAVSAEWHCSRLYHRLCSANGK